MHWFTKTIIMWGLNMFAYFWHFLILGNHYIVAYWATPITFTLCLLFNLTIIQGDTN
jgi:hypothetical protein